MLKRSAPSGVVTQMLPFMSASIVPDVPDMRRGRDIDVELLGLGIELGEPAMPALDMGADVEPQDAVLVAHDAVAAGDDAAAIRHREMLHRAGLGVDPGIGRRTRLGRE